MPVRVVKRGSKYRLIEPNGRIAKNAHGTPVDGGGHKSKTKALRQMRAINMHKRRK